MTPFFSGVKSIVEVVKYLSIYLNQTTIIYNVQIYIYNIYIYCNKSIHILESNYNLQGFSVL